MPDERSEKRGVSIREAATLSGLPETTLRYYEQIGIIPPIRRDPQSHHRYYSDEDIEHLVAIARLNAIGMPIADIKRYFINRPKGTSVAHEQITLFEKQVTRIDKEMRQLELQREYAVGKVAYWRAVQSGDKQQRDAISKSNHQIGSKLIQEEKTNG